MSIYDWLQLLLFIGLLLGLTPLLGQYIANVFTGNARLAQVILGGIERLCYRIGGIDPAQEMSWKEYGKSLLFFNMLGFMALFLLQTSQRLLPLNPQGMEGVPLALAFNTSISFVTNTNWQAYSGEATLSYLTQMLGITSQNFLSAASGMAVFVALTRGFARKKSVTIGNFWVDLVRTVIYLLLPLSILLGSVLLGEGVIQTFLPYQEVITLEGKSELIPLGPVASQVAIKQLGTNGGGFFNANSAHPFENPTALSNLLEMLAILIIPAASVYAYGILTQEKKHARLLFFTMGVLWMIGVLGSIISEYSPNEVIGISPLLEGKETRFGVAGSLLWAISTTATSNGSVNAMMSSLSPLASGIAMFNIMVGEVIFGGIGVGMCSMIMLTLLTVFLSGLMAGRTPEYLGKKIEKNEMQWVVVAVLVPGALTLLGSGVSSILPEAVSHLGNQGPHGLSEILYAFASAAGNNGSAFSGLQANTTYYNLTLGVVMLCGRVAILLPSLAIAGSLARKKNTPASIGTFSTDSGLFFILLISVILIVGALTFFPALSLGPIVEHLLMGEGRSL